ncbi:transcriptional regulator of the Arc/MetJ class [Sphingomonas sp. Leaf412]|uniref:type II toxin-antitoxin system VapB family antitoxin n=1 Tax=Sphingomonas sp. Leaf412 TaxID=1736370 RepID=UPI0006FFFDC8|nr:type II toxin-antitoxin system VapB family antitoxin [Sphingomonas sp. Leaf412]KQT32057.1 transcriptional regulator of the Arc/MetJ class [Sphingomonas sp. Leaf412]
MRTNIDIDDDLMSIAMRVAGKKTKRETVDKALRQMVAIAQQEALLELRGIGWEGDLDEMRTSKYAGQTW